jgi:hypothetical protein
VNVTTWRQDKDQSCLLNPGDHPEIKHNSVVNYFDSRVHSDGQLDHLFNSNKITLYDPFPEHILKLIRDAVVVSGRMKIGHRQILIAQGLLEE